MAFGVWRLAFGVWRLAFGVWRVLMVGEIQVGRDRSSESRICEPLAMARWCDLRKGANSGEI